jgi:hypothetical protein
MRIIFVTVLLLIQGVVFSQDIQIMKKIDSLQSRGGGFYTKGLFPSQVRFENSEKFHKDNNSFFTGLTLYTLQSMRQHFSSKENILLDSMEQRTTNLFQHYRNRKGGPTYNFYQTHPDIPYAGIKVLSKLKKVRLADDLDVTSIIYLIRHSSDSLNAQVKKLMELQTRKPEKVNTTFKKYQYSKAYRTWFAQKMKQDLDICVMANTLLFIYSKKLPLDSTDYSTIELIKRMVNENEIMKHGYIVSSYYQISPIILYHLSRLISIANNPQLNSLIPKIVVDIKKDLKMSTNKMEQIILLSSLYRLKQPVPFHFSYSEIQRDMQSFYWFRAYLLYGNDILIKRIFGPYTFLNLKYKSPAYYWSLVMELQALSGATIHSNGHFGQTTMTKTN